MSLPLLTREQSRQIDALAIERYGISSLVLMENAGRGVAEVLLEVLPDEDSAARTVVVLCGKGNNGGDGFVIARHLSIRGVNVRVLLLASPDELQGDARQNYEILHHCDVPIVDLSGQHDLPAALDAQALGACWLVDAMLGTGAHGEPREPVRTAIEWMNAQNGKRLAVDVPSGLDCDTGQSATCTVRAEVTCTFVASKTGFACESARPFLGDVHVVSIGTPAGLLAEVVESP